jgi:hypothetical protein
VEFNTIPYFRAYVGLEPREVFDSLRRENSQIRVCQSDEASRSMSKGQMYWMKGNELTLQWFICALALLVSGCAAVGPVCGQGLSSMVEAQLFFGGSIAPEQWRSFLNQEVSPRFPDGFTVFDTQGQWRNRDSTISRETGHALLIIITRSNTNEEGLNAIRDAYKRRFMQESVLLAESPICAGF